MFSSNPKGKNSILALSLFGLAGILMAGLILGVFIAPDELFSSLDRLNVKYILLVCASLLILVLGLFLYWILHVPTVCRLIVVSWRVMLGASIAGLGYSVFGIPKLVSLNITHGASVDADFAFSEASWDVGLTFLACFLGLAIMSYLYFVVRRHEEKIGATL